MAVYGYDYYGKTLYGAESAVQYSVEPVLATSIAPGHIRLTWGAATQNTWTTLRIVRSPFGVPAHADNGTVIAEIARDSPNHTYHDLDLPQGRMYYYALFLGVSAWSSTDTYQAGDVAAYNGVNFVALKASANKIPGGDPGYWQQANVGDTWIRAGAAAGLSVADHGYALRMYQGIPRPYRLDTSEVTGYEDGITNPDLFKFLSIFGHQLDTLATEVDVLRDLHNVVSAPSSAIHGLAHQLGITTEASDDPLSRRLHTSKATSIARSRGTNRGIADLITTLTEWDVEIDDSTNLMLNQDQANWASPTFPNWDADLTYQRGDTVRHGGALWSAATAVSTIYADTMTVAASSGTVTKYTPTGSSSYYGIGYTYRPRLALSGTTNGYVTVNFTVATSGTYDLSIKAADGTAYGKTTYSVDGVASILGTVDHYLAGVVTPYGGTLYRTASKTCYLGRYVLGVGTHTLKIQIVGKNAAAKDYLAGLDSLGVTELVDPAAGQEPTLGSIWWTKITDPTGVDVGAAMVNPITMGPSTWTLRNLTNGSYPGGLSVAAGIRSVTSTDLDNNAGTVRNAGSAASTLGVRSVGTPTANAWSSTLTYTLDNLVRDGAGTVWRALQSSEGVAPGSNRHVWEIADIQGSAPLSMASMVRQWGIPLHILPQWSPQVRYVTGDQVAFNNFAYTALADSRNAQPDGDATDTTFWQYAGPAQQNFTASAYTASLSGATGISARAFIDWYDAQGTAICTVTDGEPWSSGFFQRFDEPTVSLHGTKGYSSAWEWDGSGAWTTSGTWVVSDGMLSAIVPSTTPYKVWALQSIPWGTPIGDLKFFITFMSRPRLGSAAEQGIFFRSDASTTNFWLASRTRLTKTAGSTITTMATWPEIPDGGRIYVSHTGSLIEVYQYVGPGTAPKKLASVAQAAPDGACFGLMERSL